MAMDIEGTEVVSEVQGIVIINASVGAFDPKVEDGAKTSGICVAFSESSRKGPQSD